MRQLAMRQLTLLSKALADATARQNSGEYTNALAISHYPLKQFVTAYNLAVSDTPYDEKGNKAFLVEGERREGEGCSYMDIGVFDLYKSIGVKTILCGHEHTNDYVVNYLDMTMVYGVKTGYFSSHDDAVQGGTLITIDKDSNGNIKKIYIQ